MVTLQGVIILRITDFRRFFNSYEFERKKQDFLSLFQKEIQRHTGCNKDALQSKHFFVDTDEEYYLLQKYVQWLLNPDTELLNVTLKDNELKIGIGVDDMQIYPLGKLQTIVSEKRNVIKHKVLIGYILLYLLLNLHQEDIVGLECTFGEKTNSSSIQEFNYCTEDIKLESTHTWIKSRRCTFVNVSKQPIKIKLDNNSIRLEPNECVIGIFCGNKCYKLLPNNLKSNHTDTSLKLISDGINDTVTLEMRRPIGSNSIQNVVSIGFDDYGHPIYMTDNGNIINPDEAPMIDLSIQHLRQYSNAIAFELNGGHITLYTTDRIIG